MHHLCFLLTEASSLCAFQLAWSREDYPTGGFPLDSEWAAFELSLTGATSLSQAVHEVEEARTYLLLRIKVKEVYL